MDSETLPRFYELPFCLSVQDALFIGSSISIHGSVPHNATQFVIDFCCPVTCCFIRQVDGKDVAFGLQVFFDRRYVVRNSTKKYKWGKEEITSNQNFPFTRGADFFLEIFVAEREFLIAINGIHYCAHTMRTALESIQTIEIEGDVILRSVVVNHNQPGYPTVPRLNEERPSIRTLNINNESHDCSNLATPLMYSLSKELEIGNVIQIKAKVKLLPLSFVINLQNSQLCWPQPGILLHINGCYSYSQKKNEKNRLFVNSWLNNSWGADIILSNGCLPMPGSFFTVQIICQEDHFKITTDENVIQFPYRESLNTVKIINIHGDIRVSSISFSSNL